VRVEVATCSSALIDGAAVTSALDVELAQEGIRGIEWRAVTTPGLAKAAPEANVTTVSLAAFPCIPSAQALTYEVTPAGQRQPLLGNLELAGVDASERPRLVALAVAERLRSFWVAASASEKSAPAEATSAPGPAAPSVPVPKSGLPVDANAPPGTWSFVPAPRVPSREAASGAARSPERVAPARGERRGEARPAATETAVDVAFEVRRYFGSATWIYGGRAAVDAPIVAAPLVRVRVHADAGAGFAASRGTLGEVATTSATAALAVVAANTGGPLEVGLGPRVEAGWVECRGVSPAVDVRTGSVSAPLGTLGLEALVSARFASRWRGVVEADLGRVFGKLDALADGRVVAGVDGLTLGARIGLGYSF
jgi:hypothetical protein